MKQKIFVACLMSSMVTMMLIETVLEKPYVELKSLLKKNFSVLSPASTSDFAGNCDIPSLDTVRPGSTLIIGHAYGAPNTKHEFISARVDSFIRTHAPQLEAVIFSGDVLNIPSKAKWKRLKNFSAGIGVDFHIAPGNHDVGHGDNARRDIWNESGFRLPETGVTMVEASGFTIFLEDSVKTEWRMSPKVINAVNGKASDKPKLLIRHNIAIDEMFALANSHAGYGGELPSMAELTAALSSDDLTVISGDSSAFPWLPRLSCIEQDSVKYIATGVGETESDVVIVLSDGSLFKIQL